MPHKESVVWTTKDGGRARAAREVIPGGERKKFSRREWSKALERKGLVPSSEDEIRLIEEGKKAPSADYILFLAEMSRKPPDWILLGEISELDRAQARTYRKIRGLMGGFEGWVTPEVSDGIDVGEGLDLPEDEEKEGGGKGVGGGRVLS